MGRRRHRHCTLDGRQPKESAQTLRWVERRCRAPRVHGCRYLFQKRPSLQLRCLGPLAEGSYSRSHVGLGDEWEAVTKDPWLSVTSSGVWIYWSKVRCPDRCCIHLWNRLNHAQYRSVKWLARITAISHASTAPVQKKEYLYYTPQAGKHNASYSSGFSIQDMPVASAIISPIDKAVIIHDGTIKIRGWAYSGGGHWPERVEVSGDGGSVWYETPYEKLSPKYFHAWRLWEIDLPVDAEGW